MIETLSETGFAPTTKEDSFVPNVYSDLSEFMEEKMEVIRLYKSEINEHPFPGSEHNLRSLADFRGETSDCEWAESFMLIKEIN